MTRLFFLSGHTEDRILFPKGFVISQDRHGNMRNRLDGDIIESTNAYVLRHIDELEKEGILKLDIRGDEEVERAVEYFLGNDDVDVPMGRHYWDVLYHYVLRGVEKRENEI